MPYLNIQIQKNKNKSLNQPNNCEGIFGSPGVYLRPFVIICLFKKFLLPLAFQFAIKFLKG